MIEVMAQQADFKSYMTALDLQAKGTTERDIAIDPWNTPNFGQQTPLIKNGRLRTLENRNVERKKSIDERIVDIYRKYSNEGPLLENIKPNNLNSRQLYKKKLKEFENGAEFKRMGCKRESQLQEIECSPAKEADQFAIRRPNIYCCDYNECRIGWEEEKKLKMEYKCNDKFQRMLKIKDKIRKKNNLAVSKLKEKYQSQYQAQLSYNPRQTIYNPKEANYGVMAKATIQRNKLKLKMRGLSKQDIKRKGQLNQTDSFSIESRNIQFKTTKDGLSLVFDKWKCLEREAMEEKMSQTLPYFNR